MPIIVIYGIHPDAGNAVDDLRKELQKCVSEIPELRLTKKGVSVRFPADIGPIYYEDEPTLNVIISGLFRRPERTRGVCQTLANVVCKTIAAWAAALKVRTPTTPFTASQVEVLVERFDLGEEAFSTENF
ncbi:MAG: hypothetical protein G01um1014106_549 [Parcubacteria group bacterium Gr01-1014_106]|nr:MAG: hypothetical protein G01um1014106_549 [Parcubacteria group bacterium Gr01-1014_106]